MTDRKENGEQRKKLKVIDKRRAGRDVDAPSVEPSLKPSYVEQLESKIARMESALGEKVAELEEEARRSRERVARDLEKRFEDRSDALILDVLEMIEAVDRAAEAASGDPKTREGLELLSRSLEKFLEKNGLQKIFALGEEFDPNTMEALSVVEGPKGKVVRIFREGYFRGGKLLRPARVVVGRGD